jgi:hypothetical protein
MKVAGGAGDMLKPRIDGCELIMQTNYAKDFSHHVLENSLKKRPITIKALRGSTRQEKIVVVRAFVWQGLVQTSHWCSGANHFFPPSTY